jgi:alkyl hydroperoxide reductase subunit AhpF
MLRRYILIFILFLGFSFAADKELLNPQVRSQIDNKLSIMIRKVYLTLYLSSDKTSADKYMSGILSEIMPLNDKLLLTVTSSNSTEASPRLLITTEINKPNLIFQGTSDGYLFGALVDTLAAVGSSENVFSAETKQRIRNISHPVSFQVLVTPTCPYCPSMALLAARFSALNPSISTQIINLDNYPALAEKYQVTGVPLTIINEHQRLPGAMSAESLLDYLEKYVN